MHRDILLNVLTVFFLFFYQNYKCPWTYDDVWKYSNIQISDTTGLNNQTDFLIICWFILILVIVLYFIIIIFFLILLILIEETWMDGRVVVRPRELMCQWHRSNEIKL